LAENRKGDEKVLDTTTSFLEQSVWPTQEERTMEVSYRLDTLNLAEVLYLSSREHYRDWPPFVLHAASRQAQIFAYISYSVAEQLNQQILAIEDEVENTRDELSDQGGAKFIDREESNAFSSPLDQALDKPIESEQEHLPEVAASTDPPGSEALDEKELSSLDEADALEQLQDAFVEMMEVVRELAVNLSTDALKFTCRFRCTRSHMSFTQTGADEDEAPAEEVEGEERDLKFGLALILQLFEEGRDLTDDLPAVELQLDVEDLDHLHETLENVLNRYKRSRRLGSAPVTLKEGVISPKSVWQHVVGLLRREK
jgi:hypothetical protein